MISVVRVTVAGVEVIFSFERVFCADSSLSARDCQVLQSKLPVAICREIHQSLDRESRKSKINSERKRFLSFDWSYSLYTKLNELARCGSYVNVPSSSKNFSLTCDVLLYWIAFTFDQVGLTIESGKENGLTTIHVVVTLPHSVRLFQPVRLEDRM